MQESYGEGLASHTGPESCVVARKGGGEALTGVRVGRVLSRENHPPSRERRVLRGADALAGGGRPHPARRSRKVRRDPARSETPHMHGNTSHGNREVPRSPAARKGAGRIGKSKDSRR
jgi:hypothetical protein